MISLLLQLIAVILLTMSGLIASRILIISIKEGPDGLQRLMDDGGGFKAFLTGKHRGIVDHMPNHSIRIEIDEDGTIVEDND